MEPGAFGELQRRHVATSSLLGLMLLVLGVITMACGAATDPPVSAATATPMLEPLTPTPPPAPTTEPTPTPTLDQGNGGGEESQADLIAEGKVIFEDTAGGVGCAICHGLDGKGDPGFAAPPNRGATMDQVLDALATRPQMSFIEMSDDEVKAVVAYLKYLETQP